MHGKTISPPPNTGAIGPEAVDLEVGRRIRVHRHLIDKTLTEMADYLGVSFQQVQKYENGASRVSASRLAMIAKFLGVPMSFFFETLKNTQGTHLETELMSIDGAPALLRAYAAISSKVVRQRLVALAQSLVP